MDVRRLRYFVKVAEAGSFSRAAAVLGISQPALSRQVRLLEEEMGISLLWRDGRGVRPTTAGLRLLEPARGVLTQMDQFNQEIQASKATPSGEIRVGLTPSMNMLIAAPLIERFNERFPEVNLSVLELLSGHLEEWLVSDRCDIGIIYHPNRVRTLLTERIGQEPLSLIVARGAPEGDSDDPIDFDRLAGLPLALPSRGHSIRMAIDNTARDAGGRPGIKLEVDSLYAIKDLVARGRYCTILPEYVVRREVDDGIVRARRIVNPALDRILLLATGHGQPVNPIRELRREIIAVLRDTHIR